MRSISGCARGSGRLYKSNEFTNIDTFHDYLFRDQRKDGSAVYYDTLYRWQYEYDQLDEWDKFELDVFWAVKL